MSVLALKAIDYGADNIPDKFFEKLPIAGKHFTPAEKKQAKEKRDKKDRERHTSEQRSSKRSSRQNRSPSPDYSGYSEHDDTDYERERAQRKKDRRRRARSEGRDPRQSLSRGRDDTRDRGIDSMAHAEQGGPYFPPPPASEYRPYNPQEYAPQVNIFSPSRSATFPTMAGFSTPANVSPGTWSPMTRSRPWSNVPIPTSTQSQTQSPFEFLSRGTPLSARFSPSSEPPLAALFSRPLTNAPKPAQGYPAQPPAGSRDGNSPPYSPTYGNQHRGSTSAAKYTPGPGYAPSPLNNDASIPPPVGANAPYAPYNPVDYNSNRGANYPSPPPLSRQRSNSQPSTYGAGPVPAYPTYIPPSADQRMTAYDDDQPSSRRGSTKPRREHRHRARSADTHSSRNDHDSHRENSRMAKVRERFDGMDMRERGLAATVGGALAGGLAGRQLGKSTLTTLAGVAAGALGGRAISDKRSRSRGDLPPRSRSRSRHRHHDRSRSRDRSQPRGLRARSRSIIDRFRSKSRGPEDRDSRKDRNDRPDRGYDRGYDDKYEYFSSESEGDGSPVHTRRHRSRRDY